MPTIELNEAIQLIGQGQHEQAQPILQALIQANPQDLVAWSWYVKSCRKPEERYKVLQTCLKLNPGNHQVIDAILKLEEKHPIFARRLELTGSFGNQARSPATATVDADTHTPQPNGLLMSSESSAQRFTWYEVWFKALTKPNLATYTELLRDPLTMSGRVYWWAGMASVVSGLTGGSLLFASEPHLEKSFLFITISATIVIGILSLTFQIVLCNFLARLFGGTGNFMQTAYLIISYETPLSLLAGIFGTIIFIPLLFKNSQQIFTSLILVGTVLGYVPAIYSLWLNTNAIRAAHRLGIEQAIAVMGINKIIFAVCGFALRSLWLLALMVPYLFWSRSR